MSYLLLLTVMAAVSGLFLAADRQMAVVYGREGMTPDAEKRGGQALAPQGIWIV